jgi:uncharacterized protein YciI
LFYLVVRKDLRPRSHWPAEVLSGHLQWAGEAEGAGRLLVSGPILDGSGGIYLIKAAARAEAETVARADPAISSGCCGYELHEWDIRRGRALFDA